MSIQLRWPTDHAVITQAFGARPAYYGQFGLPGHEGVDIRAPHGSPIYACADGEVVTAVASPSHAYGTHIKIRHAGGYRTAYGHLARILVKVGQRVGAGQQIGMADSTGNSSASHLHLTLYKEGATALGQTRYPSDIIDPTAYLVRPDAAAPNRYMPNHPLRGLHDGADWMFANGVQGWAVEVVYSGDDLNNPPALDFSKHERAGIRVLARLNYSYAKADGGQGTFPKRARYDDFVAWCLAVIRRSRGVWGWVIGNEPNRAAERPDLTVPITAADVSYIYNAVWYNAPLDARISPPAIDPTNYESGDPREYWRRIVEDLQGAEFFALHAYSYTHRQAVDDSRRFGAPMQWQYYGFRMWEPLAAVLYSQQVGGRFPWRTLPIVITECNHLFVDVNGGQIGWNNEAGQWISDVYGYVKRWNSGPGDQFVHGVCMYRHHGDGWRMDDKPTLLDVMKRV